MNFGDKIIGVLLQPVVTMKEIAEKPLIEEGLLVVGVYAVLSAAVAYLQISKITYNYVGFSESQMEMIRSMTPVFGVIGGIIAVLLTWFVLTGIVHLLALAGGGEGRFYPQMMVVTGYGMLPLLLASIISFVLVSQMGDYTVTISASDPTASRQVMETVKNDPYLQAAGVIGVLAWLWSAAIIFFGVKHAHRLTSNKAGFAIGVPLIIVIALTGGLRLLF